MKTLLQLLVILPAAIMLAVHPLPMGLQGPVAGAPPPDLPEVAGARLGLVIRLFQALIAAAVLAFMCAPTSFPPDPEFRQVPMQPKSNQTVQKLYCIKLDLYLSVQIILCSNLIKVVSSIFCTGRSC